MLYTHSASYVRHWLHTHCSLLCCCLVDISIKALQGCSGRYKANVNTFALFSASSLCRTFIPLALSFSFSFLSERPNQPSSMYTGNRIYSTPSIQPIPIPIAASNEGMNFASRMTPSFSFNVMVSSRFGGFC